MATDLSRLQRRSDPVALLTTIRRCQGQLAVLASGEQGSALQASRTDRDLAAENRSLEVFLGGLQTLWQTNQPRRRKPKPRTGKRTRPDPFAADVERIEQWLQAEPQLQAKTLLERLIRHNPDHYGARHLRTLQRRLRGYRLQWIEKEMATLVADRPSGLEDAQSGEKPVLPGVNWNG
ncbi:hypothetical protein I1E95_14640 [Synechococcus sp. CBW1107]|uniref:hypothetical protein n=1 Tax=Synechococcus sp. CBW1107 TaxID=2789857 RepID=UPI0018CDC0D9|nr:hypothetical protein [Synechococcus sp. CBW1107]QPN56311.1 hypothetical protein I1E95_14640 [Synechococcus sp. CBW1107]